MRRPALDIVEHEGTIGKSGRNRATIFEGAMAHFIRMLYDAYPNPYEAIPREYGMNGRDSHIEAGKAHIPIEVELPSLLKPVLIIRDHGVGMSLTDIEEKFLAFGYSTKQDTNDQTGSLGIGCKSAMTLVNQFTVTAIKNGVRVVAIVVKEEDGVPAIDVVDTSGTDEENGLEIQIPIAEIDKCNAAARRVFRFWDSNTVLINGVPNKCILEEGTVLEEDSITLISEDPDVSSNLIIMGGIAYPTDIEFVGITGNVKVVAKVPIGMVDFTLSREKLWATPQTEETEADLKKFVEFHYIRKIQDHIDAAPTRWEAFERLLEAHRLYGMLPGHTLTWRGEQFPGSVNMKGWRWPYGHSGNASMKSGYMSQDTLAAPKANLIVVGCPNASVRKEAKQATIDYVEALNQINGGINSVEYVYFCSSLGRKAQKWLEDHMIVEYTTIMPPKVKEPKPRGGPRQRKKWGVINDYGMVVPTDQPLTGHVIWIERMDRGFRNTWNTWTREKYRAQIPSFFKNVREPVSVVVLGKSEVSQFLRAYPAAYTMADFLRYRAKKIDEGLNDDIRIWGNRNHVLTGVKPDVWLDPNIRRIAERVQACRSDETKKLIEERRLLSSEHCTMLCGVTITFKQPDATNDFSKLLDNWSKEYPIFQRSHSLGKHEIECINALFHYRRYNKKKPVEATV